MRVKLLFDIETYNYKLTSCSKNYESMLSEKFKLTAKFALASALSLFRGPVAGAKNGFRAASGYRQMGAAQE